MTSISRMHCQRETRISFLIFRVISFAPMTITNINAQVVTMVRLSVIKPCCQKTVSSGLSFMTYFLFEWQFFFFFRLGKMFDKNTGNHKTEKTNEQALQVSL